MHWTSQGTMEITRIVELSFFNPLSPSSQGNLVHTLNNANPSKLLTSAITSRSKTRTMVNSKEEDFYLGLLAEDRQVGAVLPVVASSRSTVPQSFEKIYTITSGDPSRGSLALDGEDSPPAGSRVKVGNLTHSVRGLHS